MSHYWLELADRLYDGEALDPEECQRLSGLLADSGNRREAAWWLALEGAIRSSFKDEDEQQCLLISKERLLAKVVLREKELGGKMKHQRPLSRGLVSLVAAAALLVAILLSFVFFAPCRGIASDIQCEILVLGGGEWSPREECLYRGNLLKAGQGGAQLNLGGYCKLSLRAGTVLRLGGSEVHEAIELRQGEVTARVDPGEGGFTVLTPLGTLEVKGTEFVTSVHYPDEKKEDCSWWVQRSFP